jgi:hypothetical protein
LGSTWTSEAPQQNPMAEAKLPCYNSNPCSLFLSALSLWFERLGCSDGCCVFLLESSCSWRPFYRAPKLAAEGWPLEARHPISVSLL